MLGLSSSSKEGRFSVLFDVSSASVGVGIVMRTPKKMKLLWESRIEYGYQSGDDFERYVRTMYATLLEAGMKVSSEGFREVKQTVGGFRTQDVNIYCVLSSPWFFGAVDTEVEGKEKPFSVSFDTIKKLQEKGYAKVLGTQECLSWQDVMGTPRRLETFADRVKIDGYKVCAFDRRSVHELSVQTYYSIVPETVQEHIEEVLQKVFPNHDISYATSTRVFSDKRTILSKQIGQKRSLLVELTGEMTTITLIKHTVPYNTVTAPLGTNHVLRAMSPGAVSAKEARGPIDVLYKKNKEIASIDTLPENLQIPLRDWHRNVSNGIQSVSAGVTPPIDIVIITDAFWRPFYTATLAIPWEMPGVRKMLPLHIRTPLEIAREEEKTIKQEEMGDMRLITMARSLQVYTNKTGVCYTEKNLWV